MTKLCECGCGQPTLLAKKTHKRSRHVKGEPVRFLRGHHSPGVRPPRQPLQGLSPTDRFWHYVDTSGDCWMWQGFCNDKGYGRFMMYSGPKDKNGRPHFAHRFAWALEHGPIPDGRIVCHHCDTPGCVRARCSVPGCEHLLDSVGCESHLFLGTPQDNSSDMQRKGRGASGDKSWIHNHPESRRGHLNPMAAFTEEMVGEIRRRYAEGGLSHKRLAREYGVTPGAIQSVVERKTWDWVDDGLYPPEGIRARNAPRGEAVKLAKLTADAVRAIRRRYDAGGTTHQELANEFGVTKHTVGNVVRGKTWRHVID